MLELIIIVLVKKCSHNGLDILKYFCCTKLKVVKCFYYEFANGSTERLNGIFTIFNRISWKNYNANFSNIYIFLKLHK